MLGFFIVIEIETVASCYAMRGEWELGRVWKNVAFQVNKSKYSSKWAKY